MSRKPSVSLPVCCVLLLAAAVASAQVARQGSDPLSRLAVADPRLAPAPAPVALEAAPAALAAAVSNGWQAFQAAAPVRWQAYVDRRTGRLESAVGGGIPWLPGAPGAGNGLRGPVDLAALEAAARAFLPRVAPLLGVDPAALTLDRGRSGQVSAHLWYVDFNVNVGSLPLEGARVVFRVNSGNLIEIGGENLPAPGAAVPSRQVGRDAALAALAGFVHGFGAADTFVDGGSLHLLPAALADPRFVDGFEPGNGRGLALVWQFVFHRRGVPGTWRARVDAASGEVRELLDVNHYARATGGAYTANGPESEVPMPFADLGTAGSFADSAGFYPGTGAVTSRLQGKYVTIVDTCGAASQGSDWKGDLDFGVSGGTDCTTPGLGGAGNTHAARTQFYNVNRIKEVGRAWLPANTWLQGQLQVNVNLDQTCNAYWDGTSGTINFFKSGGGCGNTGEIAGVSLHEYSHGLDQNDGNGSSADLGTAESYADFTSTLMTHNSCVGPGFTTHNCTGYGDACTACTGIRDLDFAKHAANTPARVNNFTQPDCPANPQYAGPCGREGHCESYVPSEAMWDLANRDLPNPGSAAAWTITERLWYLSRATATSAFTCHTGANPWTADGCNTGSLWRTLRAADDDDGNLANGTPHSCQLFAAFDRHGLACASDPGANVCFAACTPPIVPALTAAAGSGQVAVSWSNAGAGIVYDVYRSELGCGAGFVRIADSLAGTSLTDTEVAGGNSYSYQVVAHPTGGTACAAAPTACQSATPTVPSCVGPPAPATPTATTAGVTRVDLTWPTVPAAAGYNVYRANAAGGPYALRATVAANAYSDTGLTGGTTYYYRVRAFANACESADSGVVPGATQACTRVTLYKTDFEAGSGLAGWGSQLLSGSVNDWRGLEACSPARSGSNVFRFGAASCTGSYSAGEYATAYTPPIAVPPNSGDARLSFWHRHSFEQGYDGGTVILSVDGGAFSSLPAAALSGEVYNSTIATGANTCPPPGAAGLPSFTGTTNTLANTVVELDPTCGPNGCALHSLRPGFAAVSDCFITQQGWYLDDVEVSTCVAPAPLDLYTLPPCRLIDTRNPNGPGGGPSLAAAGERAVTATGVCGVPASAKALALNVTVFQPGADGTLQVVPADSPALTATTTSFLSGVTRANNAIVGLASDGSGALKVRSGTTVTVDFILDLVGYFQ